MYALSGYLLNTPKRARYQGYISSKHLYTSILLTLLEMSVPTLKYQHIRKARVGTPKHRYTATLSTPYEQD